MRAGIGYGIVLNSQFIPPDPRFWRAMVVNEETAKTIASHNASYEFRGCPHASATRPLIVNAIRK